MFIFKFFAAMVTADAIDRHLREQQHRAWIAEDERRANHAALKRGAGERHYIGARAGWDSTRPERPT
jgi:hypothetical protein